MKVLLLSEVVKIGRKGEIVDVSEGYAKNFLFRKKLAQVATPQIILEHKQREEKEIKIKEEKIKEISSLAKKLSEQSFRFQLKTGKNGEIFSSIHNVQIKDKIFEYLKNNGGSALTVDDIQFESKPIKELGVKIIEVKIGKGDWSKSVKLKIDIVSEKE